MNLLEVDLNYEDVPKDELKEFIQILPVKKEEVFCLKDGTFINLEEDNIKQIWDILNYLGVSGKDLDDDGIKVSKNAAVYLNNVLEREASRSG